MIASSLMNPIVKISGLVQLEKCRSLTVYKVLNCGIGNEIEDKK